MNTRREFLKTAAAAGIAHQLGLRSAAAQDGEVDLILTNGRFATLDRTKPAAAAVAIKDGRFVAVGSHEELAKFRARQTIDLRGRTVIPGLNDSHIHLIRGGLNYNLELRWDGVPSLADGLRMLKQQAARTPAPQWVRVVGGWSEFQFAERRMPTLAEINAAAPDTPVFILHLYNRALLNRALCARADIRKTRRTRRVARSNATKAAIPPGCSWHVQTPRFYTRRWRWDRSSRRSFRRTQRDTSCAS
jgi:predicted amidohydrolase YtcJ